MKVNVKVTERGAATPVPWTSSVIRCAGAITVKLMKKLWSSKRSKTLQALSLNAVHVETHDVTLSFDNNYAEW